MKAAIPGSVDAYIESFPQDVQEALQQVRATIKKAAPKAEEMIAYGMPAYKLNGPLVYFGGFKTHIGFYALPSGTEFAKELSSYKMGRGSVQFPLSEPMPLSLITKIVKFRVKENEEKVALKKKK